MKGYNPLWTMICAGAVIYLLSNPTILLIFGFILWLVAKTR